MRILSQDTSVRLRKQQVRLAPFFVYLVLYGSLTTNGWLRSLCFLLPVERYLKILQIISGRGLNGAVTYCKFLSEQMQRFGHQVTVLCRPDTWIQQNLPASIATFESDLSRRVMELRRVSKWIREQRFDVMHSHMSSAHAFGVLMRLMTSTPIVATAHQCSPQLHWWMNHHVIANSKSTATYQRKVNFVSTSKLSTIHCFTDLDRFSNTTPEAVQWVRNELRIEVHDFVAGVVGDVNSRKGQLYLFKAMEQIVASVPNFKLVLIGQFRGDQSYVKRLRSLQRHPALLDRVTWLGLRYNVQDYMAALDLSIVPSLAEPLGLVALESLAAGTPVVASNVGGLPEIVKPHINGLLVPPKNPDELAKAVIAMAQDTESRRQFGESGRRFVKDNFNPETLARQVESVFLDLTKRYPTAA